MGTSTKDTGNTVKTTDPRADATQQAADEQARLDERARDAAKRRREANEAAYEESIEGQELPPSVVEAQKVDAQRERETKAQAAQAEQNMKETTEMISSRPG
jgi:hypothetical protein